MAAQLTDAAAPPPAAAGGLPPMLAAELERTCVSFLEPAAFFVSWQGVLTLAYSGFTDALVDLKQRVGAAHPSLPPENPGSKWPKTSLGCLRDGQRLTPQQLELLCSICREESARFQEQPGAAAGSALGDAGEGGRLKLAIDSAAIALFECRSLERLLSCHHVVFSGGVDATPASAAERVRVAAILAEPSQPGYWFAASRDGNREAHYRGAHLGATLMHPLLLWAHADVEEAAAVHAERPGLRARGVREIIDRKAVLAAVTWFRARVDAALPGMYAWFEDASLHITLRALIN